MIADNSPIVHNIPCCCRTDDTLATMMMHRRNTLEQAVVAFSNSIYTFWNLTAPGCCSAKCAVPRCFSVRVAMYMCVHACMQGYGPDGLPPVNPSFRS